MKNWLDKYEYGGQAGYTDIPFKYNSAWGGQFQDGGKLNTPEAWEKSIRSVESEIGDPHNWTMESYNKLQNKLNEYKNWRENTKEGKAVIDYHNEPNEYIVPLPMHLRDKNTLKFLEPTDPKLPSSYVIPYRTPSSELATSIGGEDEEPAFLIPTFKYGKPLEDPYKEFLRTGEHLGGPFKTWQEADEWERNIRHPYVEKGQSIPTPLKRWGKDFAMGGSLPGSVGFTYARTQGIPSEGPYAKKTLPSAQKGKKQGNPISDWWYNLDDVQGTYKMYNDLDPFLKNWYQNPETQRRLKQNLQESFLHRNTNPSQLTSQAINTLQNTPAFSRELVKKADVSASDLEYNNELQGWKSPSTFGGNPYFDSHNYMTGMSELGSYDPDTKQIIVNSFNQPGTVAHEGVHGAPALQNAIEDVIRYKYILKRDPKTRFIEQMGISNYDQKTNKITRESFEEIEKRVPRLYDSWKKDEEYLDRDGMYPRIMDIRRTLNLKPGQKVDKSILENESISHPLYDLKHYYDDDTIIDMLNTLAKNNDAKKTMPSAQNGKDLPYHPITNPEGYHSQNTLEKIKKLPSKEKRYEPTDAVKNLKSTLSVASLVGSSNPFTEYLAQVAGGTGDLYTSARYAIDQNWPKAKEDFVQGALGFIPYAKAIPGMKIGTDYFTKGAKLFNKWLKRVHGASDIKTLTESPTSSYPVQENGGMTYYQHGLDWKPKTISRDGSDIPKNQNAEFVLPRYDMPRVASESTSRTFYDPILNKQKSTATVGQKSRDVKATMKAMGKARQREKEEEKQRVSERKSAVAAKDKGEAFTLPSGETKKYEDMSAREKMYVSGKALEQRGRFNENEESFFDEWVNPLNLIGGMAGGLATAPYEAKESDSNLPYVGAIANPVITGMLGFDPLGGALKAPSKVAQSMESGLLSNTYKLNPKAFKPQEGMMYRGLGKEGMEDAIQSGVFRPKQHGYAEGRSLAEKVTTPKQFGSTFYAPAERFEVVQNYGPSYLAEVPFEGNEFARRYGRKDWSWSTPRQIPIEEGRILQKDWLRGYKEVPNKKKGGVIKDDRGQWAHPGEITEIGSNQITMQGVPYPVLGISDQGDTKMMFPEQEYKFKGKKVTEIPIKKTRGWLKKYAEGGDVPETPDPNEFDTYEIQKGDTLFNLAQKLQVPAATLANNNALQNPNLIIQGKQLKVPKKFEKELSFEDIPTTDNKKIVIDNFSKNYDYILEGDKLYYKIKGGKTWADISDNDKAKQNILGFIDKNNYWAGYSSGEKESFTGATSNPKAKEQKTLNLPKDFPYDKSVLKSPWDEFFSYNNKIHQLLPEVKVVVPLTDEQKARNKKVLEYMDTWGVDRTTALKAVPLETHKDPSLLQHFINGLEMGAYEIQKQTGIAADKMKHLIDDTIKEVEYKFDGVENMEDLFNLTMNGMKRKLSTRFTGDTSDDIPVISKSERPADVNSYYKNKSVGDVSAIIDAPGGTGRQFKQQTLPTSNIKFGFRNRGEYKNINTDGLEVTTFDPFTKDPRPDNTSVIAIDKDGNLHTGIYKDFKGKQGYLFSSTFKNNIIDFATKDEKFEYVSGKKSGNPKFKLPKVKVLDDKGIVVDGALNILIKDDSKKDFYGSIQGGRILFVDPETKEQYLVSGSLNHIAKEFKRIKGDKKYLEAYTLDNGTYSRGLSYKDKKLTPQRLKDYDNENTGGGNGLYVMEYKQPVSKYKEEYIQTPNVRTEKDESYKKGHKLRNEIKNVVLHHTAYTNPKTNEEEVKKQYMTPGANTSHVVIQENGKRVVYASPEQVTFHAGESKWNNRDNVNDFSIGVEFQGDTNKAPLTQAQIESFVEYYTPIAKKYRISLKDIITHQMIAPGRKPDITQKEYKRVLKYMKDMGYK